MEYFFKFGFVPSAALPGRLSTIHAAPGSLEECVAEFWKEVPFPDSLIESLDAVLPAFRRISASQLRWGDGRSSCVEVATQGELLTNVLVSIDVRASYLTLVAELALVARRYNWLVITGRRQVFPPSVRRFLTEIHQSSAMRAWKCSPEYRASRNRSSG